MVHVICGPPGSGKTTYAKLHMQWGDAVIDYDLLFSALSGLEVHEKPANLHRLVEDTRQSLLASVGEYEEIRDTWIVQGLPEQGARDVWRDFGAEVIVLEVSRRECLRRLSLRSGKDVRGSDIEQAVDRWYHIYEATRRDGVE